MASKLALEAQQCIVAQTQVRAAEELLRSAAKNLAGQTGQDYLRAVRASIIGTYQSLAVVDEVLRVYWISWRDRDGH